MKVHDIRNELPSNGEYPKRDIKKITHIDIHHSASSSASYKGIDTIKSFTNTHINTNGWHGIGYHYVVAPDGTIYKTGYANEKRWSVGGNNSYTISIMLIGNLHEEDPTDEQMDAAVWLANELSRAYDVEVDNIKGHREYPNQATLCPGIDMADFRNDIKLKKSEEKIKETEEKEDISFFTKLINSLRR